MAVAARPTPSTEAAAPDYWLLAKSFRRRLLATNHSPATIRIYMLSVEQFGRFLEAREMPLVLAHITREHVETFIGELVTRSESAGVETRYRGLQAFFKWAVEDGEIEESPMARMKRPAVHEAPPMLSDDDLRKPLKVCEGREFESRRDTAIVRLFVDTGMRRSELANLKRTDLNLDHNFAMVVRKGRRPRACPFGRKTAQALDRYLRERARHRLAEPEALRLEKWQGADGQPRSGLALSAWTVQPLQLSRRPRPGEPAPSEAQPPAALETLPF